MKIYLLDRNKQMTLQWEIEFKNIGEIEIVNDTLKNFLNSNKFIDCIVTPGNCLGEMSGGFDGAIIDYYGMFVQTRLYESISQHGNKLSIADSLAIDINEDTKLIYTPTMEKPSFISDSEIIYRCMISSLKKATDMGVNNIIIPAFGAGTGGINTIICSQEMYKAYSDYAKSYQKVLEEKNIIINQLKQISIEIESIENDYPIMDDNKKKDYVRKIREYNNLSREYTLKFEALNKLSWDD